MLNVIFFDMFNENALKTKKWKRVIKRKDNHTNLLKNKNHAKKKVLKKFSSS